MKKVILKIFAASLAILLTLSCFLTLFASCAEKKKVEDPIFACGEAEMPLYFYEFMLSRQKGDLSSNKIDVESEKFWSTVTETDETYEEYYNREVLESCKKYFAVSVLFDQLGLSLSQATLYGIDEDIERLLELSYVGDGDVDKLNSILAEFGVDMDELRECYIILAKKDAVIESLYGSDGSLISDGLKNSYYLENYYRFKQILFRKYYCEYVKDEEGKEIYFDPESETAKPLYDKENGEFRYKEDGNYVRDGYGEVIYFGLDGKPIYDTEKGMRMVAQDDLGNDLIHDYTKEELADRRALAESIVGSIEKRNYSYFESELEKYVKIEDLGNSFPEGNYLSDIESGAYKSSDDPEDDFSYLKDILALLKEMDDGEVRLFESDFGYHVIMKYSLDDGRFADGEYVAWFNNFLPSLMTKMFDGELEKIMPDVVANEENIAKARSIKDMGINYNY